MARSKHAVTFASVSTLSMGPEATRRPCRRSAACVAVLGISSTWCVTRIVVGDASAVEERASSSSSRPGRSSAGRRLVEQQQLRASEQRSGEQHPLAFALTARLERASREVLASHPLEQLVGESTIVGVERLHPGDQGGALPGEHHVTHGEVRGDGLRDVMSDEADPRADVADVHRPQAAAEDLDDARRGMPDPARQVQQGGLAGAVRSQDRPRLAGTDRERHRPQDGVRRDRDRRVVDPDDIRRTVRLHRFPSMPSGCRPGVEPSDQLTVNATCMPCL